MEIREIEAAEVQAWARSAAEHMFELRTASGALPLTSAGGFIHGIISRFRVGVPIGSRIFVNDNLTNWLWISTSPECVIVDALIDSMDDGWHDILRSTIDGTEATFESFYTPNPVVDALDHRPYSIDLIADARRIRSAANFRSDIYLRPMSSGEIMQFMTAAANERGRVLAQVTPRMSVNELKRDAFRELEDRLRDGVDTPGQLLYCIQEGYETVGYAWLELDAGTGYLRSVTLKAGCEDYGVRTSAVIGLAEKARREGMRRLAATIIPPSNEMAEVLRRAGFSPVRLVTHITEFAKVPAAGALVH